MKLDKLVVALVAFVIVGCGHLPMTRVTNTAFKGAASAKREDINLNQIEIYESEYPAGIEKSGDLVQVAKGSEDKIAILGKVTIDLEKGKITSPFPVGPKAFIYVNDEDITGLHKYCLAMNWQTGVFLPLMWIPNYIAPWNWPCYAVKDRGGDENVDVQYRTETLKNEARKAAQKLGGNAVVGFEIGGMSIINARSGATLANSHAWTATGFVVALKK